MLAWLDWQADIAAWRSDTNNRLDGLQSEVESLHEVVRLVPELLERMGPATLSPEHQGSVQALAKRLHEVGGFSFADYLRRAKRRLSRGQVRPDQRCVMGRCHPLVCHAHQRGGADAEKGR